MVEQVSDLPSQSQEAQDINRKKIEYSDISKGDWSQGKSILRRYIWVTCFCLFKIEVLSMIDEWSFLVI